MSEKRKLFIIAGEASGDLHGANLIRHLKDRSPVPLEIYGVGGEKIRATGAGEFYDLAHFHVTGFTEFFKRIPQYKVAEKTILESIRKVRPDLVVLIDNPGFNLILAKHIHAMGIPIIYFIAPQVWAWGQKRVLKIKAYVQKVLVVFEFEKKIFEDHGIPVTWVGNPLKDLVEASAPAQDTPIRKQGVGRVVTLLPGSRKGELKVLFPIFLKTAQRIRGVLPGTAFCVIKSPTISREFYEQRLRAFNFPIQIVEKYAYDVIRDSDLAIACSGTATLECALLGTPVIVSNRGTLLNWLVAKSVIKVPFIGLPNLILGEMRFPEILQYDATPFKIAATAIDILSDRETYAKLKEACAETSRRIGEKGASVRAADEILAYLS